MLVCFGLTPRTLTLTERWQGIVVVPKSTIGFPRVWLSENEKKWRHADRDGIFVQLEARTDRDIWFIPIYRNAEGHTKPSDEV